MTTYTDDQIEEKCENIERQILDLPNLTHEEAENESVSKSIIRIIQEGFRTIISSAIVLWDNRNTFKF